MQTVDNKEKVSPGTDRRAFLKAAGTGVAVSAFLLACKKKEDNPTPSTPGTETDKGINLGSGDIGILNYAYALEQLEAAFYTAVVADAKFKTIFTASEQTLLSDIKAHEVTHMEFLKKALGTSAIPALTPNFSTINFGDKASVLGTAKAFEDLGVSAYNGAGHLIKDVNYLLVAGKIVSVEARHASAIRDLLNPKSADFAGDDVVNKTSGLDVSRTPSEVLSIAGAYITNKIDASNLPTA